MIIIITVYLFSESDMDITLFIHLDILAGEYFYVHIIGVNHVIIMDELFLPTAGCIGHMIQIQIVPGFTVLKGINIRIGINTCTGFQNQQMEEIIRSGISREFV